MIIGRVLIVGLGSIGQRHLRLARMLLPQADIRVLRHQPCKDLPEYANGCFFQLDDAIAFAPQLAVIASPATFHLSTAMALANVGTHLFVEMLLASELEDVVELIACYQSKHVVLLSDYKPRFLPLPQKFRMLVHPNAIASVRSVRCDIGHYLTTWWPGSNYSLGRAACELHTWLLCVAKGKP
jgi:predicted dehydrogenase